LGSSSTIRILGDISRTSVGTAKLPGYSQGTFVFSRELNRVYTSQRKRASLLLLGYGRPNVIALAWRKVATFDCQSIIKAGSASGLWLRERERRPWVTFLPSRLLGRSDDG